MVIDLEDGIHFALHLLTGPKDSDASPEGCGNTETTKVTCAQPLGRAGCPNRKQSFDAIPTTLSHSVVPARSRSAAFISADLT